jgi:hypothetical protein
MEYAKLANGSRHESPIGRSPSPAEQDQKDAARSAGKKTARKKAAQKKAESARPLRKKMGSKSKSDKLVCRYCGSDDLAPSFIKRGIADAASVSVNAMGRRQGRGRRRSRNSLTTT